MNGPQILDLVTAAAAFFLLVMAVRGAAARLTWSTGIGVAAAGIGAYQAIAA